MQKLIEMLIHSAAPGRVEMQLKLTQQDPGAGKIGLADFLVCGIKIQETQ
jgi:hypothetical protein